MPTWGDPAAAEARALGATCGGVRVWSLYVPNGREVDDPHYAYKLDWLGRLRDAAAGWLAADAEAQVALVGDWNIAPLDTDVWDIDFFAGRTHVTPAERDAFTAIAERRVHRGLARAPARPSTPTRTGTTSSCGSPGTRACAST